jgi:hypothetical protein
MPSAATIAPLAALLAGLAGSAHCFSMCGGIAGALGMQARAAVATTASAVQAASLYQIGRVAGYSIAGAIFGFIGARAAQLLDLARMAYVLRVASGVLIVLLGIRLLLRWNALQWIERLGARFWMTLRPLVQFAGSRTGAGKPICIGLLWSLLPCGLVYSMLMLAAMSAKPLDGALIMLAFGAGTLPSMLTTSLLAARLQAHASSPAARIVSGVLMVTLGTWMLVVALNLGAPVDHAH